eukprot:2128702-Pyramimonas_sp.AAC.1
MADCTGGTPGLAAGEPAEVCHTIHTGAESSRAGGVPVRAFRGDRHQRRRLHAVARVHRIHHRQRHDRARHHVSGPRQTLLPGTVAPPIYII